jgi:protein phosphatase
LIGEANEAGGRDNITVVLCRIEEVGGDDGAVDQPTIVAEAAPSASGASADASAAPPPSPRAAADPTSRKLTPLPASTAADAPAARARSRRFVKPVAVLVAIVIVLFLVGGGGYLATRQLYFVGTNPQGIVTIYRGLPYDLPAGVHLYETFFVSGVPASLVPPDRRSHFFNNQLRSQSSAMTLVRNLELGRISQ